MEDVVRRKCGSLSSIFKTLFPTIEIKYVSRYTIAPVFPSRRVWENNPDDVDGFVDYLRNILQITPSGHGLVIVKRGFDRKNYPAQTRRDRSGADRRTVGAGFENLVSQVRRVRSDVVSVILEELPFAEQVSLFLGADTLIGQHGAAFAHAHWMPKEGHLIELQCCHLHKSPDFVPTIARIRNHRHSIVEYPCTGPRWCLNMTITDATKVSALLDGPKDNQVVPRTEMRSGAELISPRVHFRGSSSAHVSELTPDSAASAAEQFINSIPNIPPDCRCRGIVIVAGGLQYFTNAWISIKLLRHLGCELPIQIWHLGREEMNEEMKELVLPLRVDCVDAIEVRKEFPARILKGWELKPYAIIHSPFREVLLLDADNAPAVNPEYLFETGQFKETGAIFWPDLHSLPRSAAIWNIFGVPYLDEPEFESGQIVVDKMQTWKALSLTMWYNEHSDFFYRYVYGDKETFHMAFRKLNHQYAMPPFRPQQVRHTLYQHDFRGTRIFQHRTRSKWSLLLENERVPEFQHEDKCLEFLNELRDLLGGRHSQYDFLPKPKQILEAAQRLMAGNFVYRQDGREPRRMTFLENGLIGEGRRRRIVFWELKEENGESVLHLLSRGKIMCIFKEFENGSWRGKWIHKQERAVELSPIGAIDRT